MNLNSFLAGMAAGAGIAFIADPVSGRRRRALARDQVVRVSRKTRDAADTAVRDLSNRTKGMAAAARARLTGADADDVRLVERVRATLGRTVSHPRAIDVSACDGTITLSGSVLASEADRLISAASGVVGVTCVEDALDRHETPDAVPALQGSSVPPGPRLDVLQRRWSPATRTLVGAAALTAIGLSAVGTQRVRRPHL